MKKILDEKQFYCSTGGDGGDDDGDDDGDGGGDGDDDDEDDDEDSRDDLTLYACYLKYLYYSCTLKKLPTDRGRGGDREHIQPQKQQTLTYM
jgi:hypothetical protein